MGSGTSKFFNMLITPEDHAILLDTFKRYNSKAARKCNGDHTKSGGGFVSGRH